MPARQSAIVAVLELPVRKVLAGPTGVPLVRFPMVPEPLSTNPDRGVVAATQNDAAELPQGLKSQPGAPAGVVADTPVKRFT